MSHDQDPSYVLGAAGAFIALDTIFVGLRFYTRAFQKAKYGADDWLALASLIFTIGIAVCLIVGVHMRTFGYPTTQTSGIETEKFEYAFQPLQILAVGFTKLSFVFFYRRIFVEGRTKKAFNIVTILIACLISLWMAGFFLQYIFQCGSHFSAAWGPHEVSLVECLQGLKAENAVAISDFLTDVIVLALPVPMVLRLHMTASRKIAVLVVFGLGIVAIVASIIRMVIYIQATSIAFQEHVDNDLLITRGLYWAMIEAGLALVACCLPTMSALTHKKSIDSAIRSVRSRISLKSNGSQRSGGSSKDNLSKVESNRRATSPARLNLRPAGEGDVESHALGPMPSLPHEHADGDPSKIWVDHHIEQRQSPARIG